MGSRRAQRYCQNASTSAKKSLLEVLSSNTSVDDVCANDSTHDVNHKVSVADTTSFHSANFNFLSFREWFLGIWFFG